MVFSAKDANLITKLHVFIFDQNVNSGHVLKWRDNGVYLINHQCHFKSPDLTSDVRDNQELIMVAKYVSIVSHLADYFKMQKELQTTELT